MEFRDYLRVIRSRAALILVCGLIVMVTTLVATMTRAPTYRGSADVLISEQDAGAALLGGLLPQLSNQPERYLQTAAKVMTLRPTLQRVITAQRLPTTPEELRERVEVTAVPQTNLIRIEVEDTSPIRAAATANAIADDYVGWARALKRRSIRAAATQVESRLAEMEKAIEVIRRKRVPAQDAAAQLAETDAAITRYSTLAQTLEQLLISEQLEVGPASIASRAVVDRRQIAPKPILNAGLALVVGLLLGVGIALLADYLDTTIKTVEDAETAFDSPVLGQIPREPPKKGEVPRLTVIENPGGAAAEAYRLLRNGLKFVFFESDVKSVLVTSAAPEEGKSTVAANLAAVLSLAGNRTVLVECDFRRPTIDRRCGTTGGPGLSDVLTGAVDPGGALRRHESLENLWVMGAGSTPPNPSELLGSATMERLLQGLESRADWIVLDTPPVLVVADAAALAPWVDGVLLVAAAGSTTRDMARKSQDMLRGVGAHVAGVVLWGTRGGSADRYDYTSSSTAPPQPD